LPAFFPDIVRGARQVVLLVVDGLGWHQLQDRIRENPGCAPTFAAMQGGAITTIAPTTTVTALTSIATGAAPGEHGMVGYRIDFAGRVVQMLRWADDRGDARHRLMPRDVQPCPPFLGATIPVLSKAEFDGTAFTEAHLRDQKLFSWRAPSSMVVDVRSLLARGEKFVYCYYDGVDKIAHERGFGEHYDAEVLTADRIVADIASVLPAGAVLVVTADHRRRLHLDRLPGEPGFRRPASAGAVDEAGQSDAWNSRRRRCSAARPVDHHRPALLGFDPAGLERLFHRLGHPVRRALGAR
jgi:hypothetical protein